MTYNLIIEKRKLIVFAQVKGVNEYRKLRFILDTGASKSIIDEGTVRRLGFELNLLQPGDRLMTVGGGMNSKMLNTCK